MTTSKPESESSPNIENKEVSPDSLLQELERIEQALEERKAKEQDLINEIADLAEGNIALAKKVGSKEGQEERSKYQKEKKVKEQERIDHLFSEEKSLLEQEEAKIPIIEEKINALDPGEKLKIEAKLAEIKKSLVQKRDDLEERTKEAWQDFEEEQTLIGELKSEQEERKSRPIDFATQDVMTAHNLQGVDLEDLKKKVTQEVNARNTTHNAFENLKQNQAEFEGKLQKLDQAKKDFQIVEKNIDNIFLELENILGSKKFQEEIQARKDQYRKKENAKLFKDPKGMQEIQDFLRIKRDNLMDKISECQKIEREYKNNYLQGRYSKIVDIESKPLYSSSHTLSYEEIRDPVGKITKFLQEIKEAEKAREQLVSAVDFWRSKYLEREKNIINGINNISLL